LNNFHSLKCAVVIVAAGKGKRMGGEVLKQYLEIGGMPVLARTLMCFQKSGLINQIVVVTGNDEVDFCKTEIVEKFNFDKVFHIVAGGKERQESVFNGLSALDADTDIVLIHDGVRPFVKMEDIENIISDTINFDCCVLGVRVKDTIKECGEDDFIRDTPERNKLWIAQTPQAFKYNIIMKAHMKALEEGFVGTDDSMLAERIGYKVKMTEGNYDNIKITTAEDLYFGEAVIRETLV